MKRKSFADTILVFFVLRVTQKALQLSFYFFLIPFFLFVAYSGETSKCFLLMNNLSLPATHVKKIGLVSLGTLSNASVFVLLVVIAGTGGQYLFNVGMEFKTNQELFKQFTTI